MDGGIWNFGDVLDAVGGALGREFLDVEVDVKPSDGRLLAYLAAEGEVLSRDYGDEVITFRVRLPAGAMGLVHKSAIAIRPMPRESIEPSVAPENPVESGYDDVPSSEVA